MTSISGPSDGPVAVTGASGFVGSHVVKNLVEHGYDVHACLRDSSREDKTSYLLDIDKKGPGSVKLFSCDLYKAADGEYDEAFAGCSVVFHVAADIGTDAATYGRHATPKTVRGSGRHDYRYPRIVQESRHRETGDLHVLYGRRARTGRPRSAFELCVHRRRLVRRQLRNPRGTSYGRRWQNTLDK